MIDNVITRKTPDIRPKADIASMSLRFKAKVGLRMAIIALLACGLADNLQKFYFSEGWKVSSMGNCSLIERNWVLRRKYGMELITQVFSVPLPYGFSRLSPHTSLYFYPNRPLIRMAAAGLTVNH